MDNGSSSKHKNKNVPKLRFPGFEGEWETLKLSDVFSEIVDKKHSELPVLSIQQGIGTVLRDTSERRISYDKNSLENYKAIQPGDFIIHLRSFEGGLECSNHFGITSPAYKILRTSKLLPIAFKDYFRSYKFIEGKLSIAVTGIRDGKNIDMPSFWEIEINIPGKREQQKIATFLLLLDERITKQRELIEKLKTYKRGALSVMFPQKGETVPRCRFASFSGDWEKRKLGDLVLIERGGSPRPIDDYITDSPDGLNWVKIGDAPEQGQYITKTAEKIKPEGLSKTRQVQPSDLILSNSMSFGKPYIMGINGCIHDGWLLIRNTHSCFDLKFLCHMLGTDQMIDQYKMFAAGSTVNNLNKELVGSTVVSLPSITEQKVIGEYLESIDHLISLHQNKLDMLMKTKQSLLQQLFI